MSEAKPTTQDVVYGVFMEIASSQIHEINNKLGSILLNAEMLAMSRCGAPETVADIKRNTLALRDLVRSLESVLPTGVDNGPSATDRMRNLERLVRGAMRRRRLRMEVEDTLSLPPVAVDHGQAKLAFLLAPLAFRGPNEGEMGLMKVTCSDDEAARTWRFDVEPRALPDAEITRMLSEVCRRNGWNTDAKAGTITITLAKAGHDVE